jgi:hypothetical protein
VLGEEGGIDEAGVAEVADIAGTGGGLCWKYECMRSVMIALIDDVLIVPYIYSSMYPIRPNNYGRMLSFGRR